MTKTSKKDNSDNSDTKFGNRYCVHVDSLQQPDPILDNARGLLFFKQHFLFLNHLYGNCK